MARTVSNGWRKFTPGTCLACGCDDDWDCDGAGNIYCSCECCPSCGCHDGHASGCAEARLIDYDDDCEAFWDGGRRSDAEGRL